MVVKSNLIRLIFNCIRVISQFIYLKLVSLPLFHRTEFQFQLHDTQFHQLENYLHKEETHLHDQEIELQAWETHLKNEKRFFARKSSFRIVK